MFRRIPLITLALGLSLSVAANATEKPKQLLLISFDGAHDNVLWAKSRALASRTGARFTYFLSCTFLMNRAARAAYQAPGHGRGKSNVGFAMSDEEIRIRLENIWAARQEGHEIASHACGHFDGKDWTKADWLAEFSTFRTALADGWKNIGLRDKQPDGWEDFARNGIKGFRAPYLSAGSALAEAQKQAGFAYDASLVTKGPAMPVKDGDLVRFGLPLIPEGPGSRPVIAMDYNLFVRHSAGFENRDRSAEFEERAYAAFLAAFNKEYEGERIPLQLGFHFVEMNAGAYWRALDRFASDVCRRADVSCISYAEAIPLVSERYKQEKKAETNSAF